MDKEFLESLEFRILDEGIDYTFNDYYPADYKDFDAGLKARVQAFLSARKDLVQYLKNVVGIKVEW